MNRKQLVDGSVTNRQIYLTRLRHKMERRMRQLAANKDIHRGRLDVAPNDDSLIDTYPTIIR